MLNMFKLVLSLLLTTDGYGSRTMTTAMIVGKFKPFRKSYVGHKPFQIGLNFRLLRNFLTVQKIGEGYDAPKAPGIYVPEC